MEQSWFDQAYEQMDLDLLKTFLEVSRTGHFGRAADNLFLTQSAVSSRLRLLEQIVGTPLLSRVRGNIAPTPAGHKLLRHAEQIIDAWNRARLDIAVEVESMTPLTIGAVPNIWDSVLQDWIHQVRRKLPHLAITAEINPEPLLMQRLQQGTLDVAFLFEAIPVTAIESRELGQMPLIMVSSRAGLSVDEALRSDYVVVDWGSAFATGHGRHYPDAPAAVARFSLGTQAHEFLLHCGGSAYLAEPMVHDDLKAARLHPVNGAIPMSRTAFAVFNPGGPQAASMLKALDLLSLPEDVPV